MARPPPEVARPASSCWYSISVEQGDNRSHTVADEKYLFFRVFFANDIEKGLEVDHVIVEVVDFNAFAVRAAVSAVVECIYRVAYRDKIVDHITIASAVFRKPVGDQQHSFNLYIRQPALVIDVKILETFKVAFIMSHYTISPEMDFISNGGTFHEIISSFILDYYSIKANVSRAVERQLIIDPANIVYLALFVPLKTVKKS